MNSLTVPAAETTLLFFLYFSYPWEAHHPLFSMLSEGLRKIIRSSFFYFFLFQTEKIDRGGRILGWGKIFRKKRKKEEDEIAYLYIHIYSQQWVQKDSKKGYQDKPAHTACFGLFCMMCRTPCFQGIMKDSKRIIRRGQQRYDSKPMNAQNSKYSA